MQNNPHNLAKGSLPLINGYSRFKFLNQLTRLLFFFIEKFNNFFTAFFWDIFLINAASDGILNLIIIRQLKDFLSNASRRSTQSRTFTIFISPLFEQRKNTMCQRDEIIIRNRTLQPITRTLFL